jgi:hypothetical protein
LPADGPILERHFHTAFAKQRLRGERFERTPEIDSQIDELAAAGKAATATPS